MPLDIAPIRQRDQDWFHDPRGNQTVAEVVRDRGDLLVEVDRLRAALRQVADLTAVYKTATKPTSVPLDDAPDVLVTCVESARAALDA